MSSIFRHQYQHPVSFLFVEMMREYVSANPETSLRHAIWAVCDQLEYRNPDLDLIVSRLQEQDQVESKKQSKKQEKTFGSSYLEWMEKQTPDVQCLIAARFDVKKAEYLYSKVDKNVAEKVLKAFTEHDWQQAVLQFESCMFGFGGSYGKKGGKKQPAGDVEEVDLTKTNDLSGLAQAFQGF